MQNNILGITIHKAKMTFERMEIGETEREAKHSFSIECKVNMRKRLISCYSADLIAYWHFHAMFSQIT